MKKLKIWVLILVFAMVLPLAGCANLPKESDIAGKVYCCENGYPTGFSIAICEDGTYICHRGIFSSVGRGTWTLDGDILCLTSGYEINETPEVNYFKVDGDDLVFMVENSSNFSYYAEVSDGERFSVYGETLK